MSEDFIHQNWERVRVAPPLLTPAHVRVFDAKNSLGSVDPNRGLNVRITCRACFVFSNANIPALDALEPRGRGQWNILEYIVLSVLLCC